MQRVAFSIFLSLLKHLHNHQFYKKLNAVKNDKDQMEKDFLS